MANPTPHRATTPSAASVNPAAHPSRPQPIADAIPNSGGEGVAGVARWATGFGSFGHHRELQDTTWFWSESVSVTDSKTRPRKWTPC